MWSQKPYLRSEIGQTIPFPAAHSDGTSLPVSPCFLEFPLPAIGSTNDPWDIASDYAWALYVGEELCRCSSDLSFDHKLVKHAHSIDFRFTPRDRAACAAVLREAHAMFSEDDEPEADAARSKANEFEASILSYPKVFFQDLADSYMANYVNALEGHYTEDELINDVYHRFPTWSYRFWKSFLSQSAGVDLYASTHSWIIPNARSVRSLLALLQLKEAEASFKLSPARPVRIGGLSPILVTPEVAVELPLHCFNRAAECLCHAVPRVASDRQVRTTRDLEMDRSMLSYEEQALCRDYLCDEPDIQWSVSTDGFVVTARLARNTLVAFLEPRSRLKYDELQHYLLQVNNLSGFLCENAGIPAEEPCRWTLLTDETFEELCYDILLRSARFDSHRIRKLGKSRSRDGGRDIEAWTSARFGKPARKWIYQCKFSADATRSLSGTQLNVNDVVDQYDADGFGVMTNRRIDATLYDKLDAIAHAHGKRNHQLETDTWSRYELERFLYPCKDLLGRYFSGA